MPKCNFNKVALKKSVLESSLNEIVNGDFNTRVFLRNLQNF